MEKGVNTTKIHKKAFAAVARKLRQAGWHVKPLSADARIALHKNQRRRVRNNDAFVSNIFSF